MKEDTSSTEQLEADIGVLVGTPEPPAQPEGQEGQEGQEDAG